MRTLSFILAASLLFTFTTINAQAPKLPDMPEAKEEFPPTEKDMIAAAKWLESTPIGTEPEARLRVNAWVVAWITKSPSVTIVVTSGLLKPFEKNPQFMPVWMAGYARYVLENNYSKDELAANMAAMKAVIACYNLGGDFKKDKALTKLINADKDGKLEEWVKEAMKK